MKKVNISQVDTFFVDESFPIEFIFFYDYKIETKDIQKSLISLSKEFWIIFGDYNNGSISSKKYNENDFFSEYIIDEDFNVKMEVGKIVEEYTNINSGNNKCLFRISILHYKNGTVIIPKLNHIIGDGYSYFYFLSVLAALSNPTISLLKKTVLKRISKPQINRTSLIDYNFTNTNIEKPHEQNNCVLKIEKIPKSNIKQEIKNIKDKYNNVVSTNDVLSAKVFKRTFEIQQTYKSNKFSLAIPMDVRRQVKELGSKYFGNGLLLHSLKLNVSELEKISTDELAIKLRESIPVIDSKSYLEYLTKLETQIKYSAVHSLKPYNPETGCLVTNLSRMPIQKLDYGKGSPKLVLPLTIGKNSAAILSDKQNYILRLAY